jgi:hypothetical protein
MRAALAAILLVCAPTTVAAQSVCGTRATLLQELAKEYQEAPVGIGLASNGSVVELLTSSRGTWTLMVTQPNGTTCLIGTGEAWQQLERRKPDQET